MIDRRPSFSFFRSRAPTLDRIWLAEIPDPALTAGVAVNWGYAEVSNPPPILAGKDFAAPSVFEPENLLRERGSPSRLNVIWLPGVEGILDVTRGLQGHLGRSQRHVRKIDRGGQSFVARYRRVDRLEVAVADDGVPLAPPCGSA